METEYLRPGFLASYFDAMKQRAREHGWRAIIPYWVIVGGAVGAALAYFQPEEEWKNVEIIVPVYVGVVTINGLLLALSWSAFSRIHELIVSSAGFSTFLRRANLFNTYIFYIDYVHVAQLLALVISGGALLTCTIHSIPLLWARIIFAACVAATIYAIRYAVNAVTVMHDLVWQKSIFEEQEEEAVRKVVKITTRQSSSETN
jgi:hypothetical protein